MLRNGTRSGIAPAGTINTLHENRPPSSIFSPAGGDKRGVAPSRLNSSRTDCAENEFVEELRWLLHVNIWPD